MKHTLRLWFLRTLGWLLRRLAPATTTQDGPPHILLIRPDHLGDVLLSRPAIDALAAALPRARLTIAVGPWGRPALGPPLQRREVRICPFPGFSRSPIGLLQPYILLARYALLWRRSHRYGIAVILRPDHWWGALLAALLGIPVRIGYHTPETRPFLTVALPRTANHHAAAEALALADAAASSAGGRIDRDAWHAALPRCATPSDVQTVVDVLRRAGVPEHEPLLVLHPAAGSPLKSWPLERLAVAGIELAAMMDARIVVTGAAQEEHLAQALCGLLPKGTLNLAGRFRWGELEALLARAALVVGVDSGPLHLAVAVGTPSLALFGPADPIQFAPWGSPARHRIVTADLPCRPCRRLDTCALEPGCAGPPPCMRAIDVRMVVAAAQAALKEGRGNPATLHQA